MRNKIKQLLACNTVTICSNYNRREYSIHHALLLGFSSSLVFSPTPSPLTNPRLGVRTCEGVGASMHSVHNSVGKKPKASNPNLCKPYRVYLSSRGLVTRGHRGLRRIVRATELLTPSPSAALYSPLRGLSCVTYPLRPPSPRHRVSNPFGVTKSYGASMHCAEQSSALPPKGVRTSPPSALSRHFVAGVKHNKFGLKGLGKSGGRVKGLASPYHQGGSYGAWRIRDTLGGKSNGPMFNKYFLPDFVHIQRKSFFTLLEKGLIEEFSKRNPITNTKKTMELFFYPEYYQLTPPEYTPSQAIVKSKSYTSRLYIPVQLTDKTSHIIKLKWVYIGNIPLMTKRGHFILNGCARVIVNQMIRSPGIYFQKKIYENYVDQWSEKPETTYERYYADLICNRGTWLRIEIDKYNKIWAQMKKVPKIPIMWFLISMGLPEKTILKKVIDSQMLLYNFLEDPTKQKPPTPLPYVKTPPAAWTEIYNLVTRKKKENKEKTQKESTPSRLLPHVVKKNDIDIKPFFNKNAIKPTLTDGVGKGSKNKNESGNVNPIGFTELRDAEAGRKWIFNKFMNPRTYDLGNVGRANFNLKLNLSISTDQTTLTPQDLLSATSYLILVSKGLRELDDIDHLKNRRVRTSGELIQLQIGIGLVRLEKNIREKMNKIHSQMLQTSHVHPPSSGTPYTLTGFPSSSSLIFSPTPSPYGASMHSVHNSVGKKPKASNPQRGLRRILAPTPALTPFGGKLLKRVKGLGLVALGRATEQQLALQALQPELVRAEGLVFSPSGRISARQSLGKKGIRQEGLAERGKSADKSQNDRKRVQKGKSEVYVKSLRGISKPKSQQGALGTGIQTIKKKYSTNFQLTLRQQFTFSNIMNTKAFNGALKEFFGSSPLSQFMDQINPLAELTHKRRLSSMGPGGVTRDSATLEIRSIHPSHYGRICPVETPEGKNTGLVNSLTAYARVNSNGYIETPFYRVYKGQVQKKTGLYFFSAKQEEKIQLGASDLYTSHIGFLPLASIPVRIFEDFTKSPRSSLRYVGVQPIQMISIATSLIPFFEHDDGNRALMGSNMQRQAVPILKPQRPIVGTGLESRAVSDSGHVIQAKFSGVVTYVSSNNIQIYSF